MKLLDRAGFKDDAWRRASAGDVAGLSHAIALWADVDKALAAKTTDQRIGVDVPNSTPIAEVKSHLPRLTLIAISFPSFADGRGFSLARHIRAHGFAGLLRATGPLIPDQFCYALACGFDEIELPDENAARQPWDQWRSALSAISQGYQRGYGGGILEQRRVASELTHV